MWYSGGSRGGARVALVSLLFLDQTEARRAKKQFFFETAPLLSRGVDDRPTPPPPPLSVGLDPPLWHLTFLAPGGDVLDPHISLTYVTVEKLKVYSRPTSV